MDAPAKTAIEDLRAALDAESRITRLSFPAPDPEWTISPSYFPWAVGVKTLIDGSDAFSSLVLSTPISMLITVPERNQRRYDKRDSVPSEHYEVMWDGSTAIVGWTHGPHESGLTGGQIVAEVLHDVAHAAGQDLFVQACSPVCDLGFVHLDLRVRWDSLVSYGAGVTLGPPTDPDALRNEVDVSAATGLSPAEVVDQTWWAIHGDISQFIEVKNLGQRILELEGAIRSELRDLLATHERSLELRSGSVVRSLRERWARRRWRIKSRTRMAQLWRAVTSLEGHRRRWTVELGRLRQDDPELVGLLFDRDLREDELIESLDLSLVQAAIEQAGVRLDNREIVLATALGALGGAAFGAVAGAVVAAISG